MIVIEGPDGSGKSTLAELIKIIYPDYVITHSPGPCPEEMFKERNFWNLEMCKMKNLIVDRISVVSEVIYGNVLRGNSHVKEEDIRKFLGEFYTHPFNTLIYCKRQLKPIEKSSGSLYMETEEKIKFEEEVTKKNSLLRIEYQKFFDHWKMIFQRVNYIEIDTPQDFNKLFKLLRETQKNECK